LAKGPREILYKPLNPRRRVKPGKLGIGSTWSEKEGREESRKIVMIAGLKVERRRGRAEDLS